MKLVFSNLEVPHIFASRTQEEGRNSSRTIFFENGTIYSYGYHFPMASFSKDDENVVFFTTRSYSNSTAKHLNYTYQALNHFKIINCFNPENASKGIHEENLKSFNIEAKASAHKLRNARKPEIYLQEIATQRRIFEKYCNHFKIKITEKLKSSLPYLFIESKDGGTKATEKEVKAIAKAKKERELKAKKEHAKDLEEFKSFERTRMYTRNGVDYLRFNPELKTIETSQGITIEMEEARRVFEIVLHSIQKNGCNDCGTIAERYKIKSIDKNFMVVGCHNIQMSEILEIGKKLFK
jgi:hypothetical protein